MLIKSFQEIQNSEAAVKAKTWTSFRFLTQKDNMGFSFHETWIHPNTETHIHYKHHLEAVYCIEGEGEVELIEDRRKITIKPGILYALDQHDEHILRAFNHALRLLCVFNPPLQGNETHGPDGAYAPSTP
ncbi:Putative L-ectoine synthase [gamma proteobacterium HdN1]|nr:Putative L-ectoine synthase [gamma proteobacterium HdN1]